MTEQNKAFEFSQRAHRSYLVEDATVAGLSIAIDRTEEMSVRATLQELHSKAFENRAYAFAAWMNAIDAHVATIS